MVPPALACTALMPLPAEGGLRSHDSAASQQGLPNGHSSGHPNGLPNGHASTTSHGTVKGHGNEELMGHAQEAPLSSFDSAFDLAAGSGAQPLKGKASLQVGQAGCPMHTPQLAAPLGHKISTQVRLRGLHVRADQWTHHKLAAARR